VVACVDDAAVRAVLPRIRRRVIRYGHAADADLRIENCETGGAGSRFELVRGTERLGEFQIHVPGAHYVLNATAAVAVLLELGVEPRRAAAALALYRGTGRRMEARGEACGITVLDDYGHHPTEVRATLEALRLRRPARLVVLFQPHRYTRTQSLLEEFEHAFDAADVVRILDIYAASETPIEGVSGAALAHRISAAGHPDCRHLEGLDEAARALARELRPGDVVLTLGAGSVTRAGAVILNSLLEEDRHGGQEEA
jgi:UDP-N-acetylmuramate--alanine ligase